MRFLRTVNEPSDRDLHYFTEIDKSSHMAWITHQGRGSRTLLRAILTRSAPDNGIVSFEASVLKANDRMLRIIRQMGAHIQRNSDEALKAEFRTQVGLEDYPDIALGRVFPDVTLQMGKTG
jgi:hypothetical protein